MSAVVHLVTGPPGADLITPLLEAFASAALAGPGAALFLVPTRRHASQVLGQLLAGRTAAVLSPHVLPLQAFADDLVRVADPALRPLSDLDRRILVDSVLADLREAGDIPDFAEVADARGFADAAVGYVRELKEAGADLRRLLKAAAGRRSDELTRHTRAARVFDRYHRRLAKLHRLDPADRLGRAAGLWAAGERGAFAGVRAVFVAGFASLARPQRDLLDAVRATAEHVWAGLTDRAGEAFAGPRELRAWLAGPVGARSASDAGPDVVVDSVPLDPEKPAGVRHLAETLFAPPSAAVGGDPPDPAGVHLFEAPGKVGEARLVARQVRRLLAAGTPPDRILVTARHLPPAGVELFCEMFDESAVPHDAAGTDPLARAPAVAFLLRAWRLAADGWPFDAVTAVLRNGYFRPAWPEVRADPEVAPRAEALLGMLGETRGRESYLGAVRAWEEAAPAAPDGELAEAHRRQRTHRLARQCRPFLERFFRAWDRLPAAGPADVLVASLRAFADDIGGAPGGGDDPADAAGLIPFWLELDRWARAEGGRGLVRADRFARVLDLIASTPCRGRTPRDAGRVRILPADAARGLDCDYLILTGLGEGSWPDLSGPESLLDDPERERLRAAGVGLPDPTARLGAEQLLFLDLVAAPSRGLLLTYTAADENGQPLLPNPFLRNVIESFSDPPIPTTRH